MSHTSRTSRRGDDWKRWERQLSRGTIRYIPRRKRSRVFKLLGRRYYWNHNGSLISLRRQEKKAQLRELAQ